MWCDDADEITQRALDITARSWDDTWPIQYGLEHCGLGNALLALGSPLPKYKRIATKVETDYLKYLYDTAREICVRHGFTVMDTRQWLDRKDRVTSCLAHAKIWTDVKIAAPNSGIENLAAGMAMIFAADKPTILRNVFATKLTVTGQRLLEGEIASQTTIDRLKDYLRKELDNV